jgi:hypothetical protein
MTGSPHAKLLREKNGVAWVDDRPWRDVDGQALRARMCFSSHGFLCERAGEEE